MHEVVDKSALMSSTLQALRVVKPVGAMLHTTAGVNSEAWLLGGSLASGKGASADYLVRRDGTVIRLVGKRMHSYHAGVCRYEGVIDTNNVVSRRYVGIEIENDDARGQIPTVAQHEAVAGLLSEVADEYVWSPLHVIGHYGYAHPMGRRSDPRGWDWGFMFWLMAFPSARTMLIGQAPWLGEYHA
jgi:N-acetyl-anhydromuramyl-L-alanine amidase AmpD